VIVNLNRFIYQKLLSVYCFYCFFYYGIVYAQSGFGMKIRQGISRRRSTHP